MFFLIFSCQKDDYFRDVEQEVTTTKFRIKATIVNGNVILKENSLLKKQVKKITNPKKTPLENTINSNNYGFSIDTSRIQIIETNFYKSYTFLVNRESQNETILENYIYTIYKDSTSNQYLVAYPIQENNGIDIYNTTVQRLYGNSLYQIENACNGYAEIMEFQEEVCIDTNYGLIGNHTPGQACFDGEYRATRTCSGGGWVAVGCSGGDGSIGTGPSGGRSGGGGSSSGGGSSTGNDNNNCVPTIDNPCPEDDTVITFPLPPRDSVEDGDCKKLKDDISDIPLIRTRLNTMIQNDGFEKALTVHIDQTTGEYVPSEILVDNNGEAHIKIPVNPLTVVIVHTHPPSSDGYFSMFSGNDIIKMGEIAKHVQSSPFVNKPINLVDITHIVIAEGRTFALRFDDADSVQKLLDIYENQTKRDLFYKKLENDYLNDTTGPPLYTTATTVEKQQEHIYNLLSEYNINMSLYEANYDTNGFISDWQKINKEDTNIKELCTKN